MEYLTTCYRRQGEGGCSLLLQQYLCRRTPVCFACLCTAEGEESGRRCRDTVESLLNWSRKIPWHRAAGRPGPWLKQLEGELTDLPEVSGTAAVCGEVKLTLFLAIGEEILALGGGQRLSLLSISFGRGKAVELPGQFRGCMEAGAGLLLATDGFLKKAEGKILEEALRLCEIRTSKQGERRLKELASEGQKIIPGKEPMAAILLIGR